MNQAVSVEELVGELIGVLDADVEAMERNISRLSELRGYVIKRDDKALGTLLDVIRAESGEHVSHEGRRNEIRRQLGAIFGVEARELTLSFLQKHLAESHTVELKDRKERLASLVKELRAEYLSTALLLNECARINSMLLRGILGGAGAEATCYGSDGLTQRQEASAFMNIRL
jgi:hypothetical protein